MLQACFYRKLLEIINVKANYCYAMDSKAEGFAIKYKRWLNSKGYTENRKENLMLLSSLAE